MRHRPPALLVALLAVAASALPAQAPPVAAGATVRVWSPELPRKGASVTLTEWRTDSLVLQPPAARRRPAPPAWVVSRGSVTRLDELVPRTRRQGAVTWGLVGAASGAATGAVLSLLAAGLGAEYYPNGTDEPGVSPFVFGVPVGALIGAAGGAVVGAVAPGTRWRRVALDE